MTKKILLSLALFGFLTTGPAGAAVTDQDFEVRTTQNLLNLCAASADDPRAKEAIQMCQDYMVGAYHFYLATNTGPAKESMRLVCMPTPPPSRNDAVAMFVA